MKAALSTALSVYLFVFSRFPHLLRFAGIPLCILVGYWLVLTYGLSWGDSAPEPGLPHFAFLLLGLWLTLILAVRWHRLTLADDRGLGPFDILPGQREWRFFGRLILISLAVAAFALTVFWILALTVLPLLEGRSANPQEPLIPTIIVSVFQLATFSFALARLGLVLPAVALDRPLSIAESWNATRGYGPQFFVFIILVDAPVSLLQWLIGLVEIPAVFAMSLNMVLLCVGTAATATALSFNYLSVYGRPDASDVDDGS